ncbi:thaumatin-like protein [Pistacia vera]|uniref:thaumatin-like protein n=1 Tax=Pistacia vera TaxID=55513 RepID=UPI001262FD17|nr:thaumatin-like protein [Pistacia vera]
MSFFKILSFSYFILDIFYFSLSFTSINAAKFVLVNNCSYTVWAAAVPGVSKKLEPKETLSFTQDSSSKVKGRIWARTNCAFNGTGNGKCESGDCNGLLDCVSTSEPEAPVTLAEYRLGADEKKDIFYISLVNGFNVPMEFSATGGTSSDCTKRLKCTGDINGRCPTELRDPGGCNHPCTVFETDQFCCLGKTCGATEYSKFFKNLCYNANTYATENVTSECPTGTDYKVVFCPQEPLISTETTFRIINKCPHPVWAASIPGGGRQLDESETWNLNVKSGTIAGRIWGRTNCLFDGDGRGKCETGDCGGLLECEGYGSPPNTLAEFSINQYNSLDFIDMSIIGGFNVPMEFSSDSGDCSRVIQCTADIIGQCPNELQVPGGCNGPCPVFKTQEHCCTSGKCGPTNYSQFFKERCPDVYSYPMDDATSIFTCPAGTNYKVVFCP